MSSPPIASDDEVEGGAENSDDEIFGFLTLHPKDPGSGANAFTFNDAIEDYPETWLDFDASGNARLKSNYKKARAQSFLVAPTGETGREAARGFYWASFVSVYVAARARVGRREIGASVDATGRAPSGIAASRRRQSSAPVERRSAIPPKVRHTNLVGGYSRAQ